MQPKKTAKSWMCSPPSAITPRSTRPAACSRATHARSASAARQMAALFRDIPEAIANTRIVSERLEFTLDNLGYEFPHYPVPDGETHGQLSRQARRRRRRASATAHRPSGICSTKPARRSRMNSRSSPSSALPDTSSSSGILSATASSRAFWCRDAARRPTPPSATRLKSPPSIRSAWSCSSSGS